MTNCYKCYMFVELDLANENLYYEMFNVLAYICKDYFVVQRISLLKKHCDWKEICCKETKYLIVISYLTMKSPVLKQLQSKQNFDVKAWVDFRLQ